MFFIITNGMYRIIGENVFNNSQDIVLTLGTITSVANIVMEGILMKETPNEVFHNFKFYLMITKSLFIDLCDFFDEDGPSLPNVVIHNSTNLQANKKCKSNLYEWKCHK